MFRHAICRGVITVSSSLPDAAAITPIAATPADILYADVYICAMRSIARRLLRFYFDMPLFRFAPSVFYRTPCYAAYVYAADTLRFDAAMPMYYCPLSADTRQYACQRCRA